MTTIRQFEEITAWQKARDLTNAVYAASARGAFAKDFGLRDQIRRAAVSVMSNIAEGFERGGAVEFARFLTIAKGSVGELRAQLYVAHDQDYLDQETFNRLEALASETARVIGGFASYLRTSSKNSKLVTRQPVTRHSLTRNSSLGTRELLR